MSVTPSAGAAVVDRGSMSSTMNVPYTQVILPGILFDALRSSCGIVKEITMCNNGHRRHKHDWCYSPLCVTCAGAWASREAHSAWVKMRAKIEALGELGAGLVPRAMWVSPSPAWITAALERCGGPDKDFISLLRTHATALMKEHGRRFAALTVVHLFRFSDRGNAAWKRALATGEWSEDRGGKWEWLVTSHRRDYQQYVRLSPHVHMIATGTFTPSPEFARSTDWTYGIIRRLPNERAFARHLKYILSHAAVPLKGEGREQRVDGLTVTWVGGFAGRYVKKEEAYNEYEDAVCSECGEVMYLCESWCIDQNGEIDDSRMKISDIVHRVHRKMYRYKLVRRPPW